LADGYDGKVKFVIEGDGRVLWESGSNRMTYDVSLDQVKQLVLRTEDGGDTNREDWALWLEPVISR
jgi:hypothetical protein